MILITRTAEPDILANIKSKELVGLRVIGTPNSSQIPGTYRKVADKLCSMQHYKCCYCEKRITEKFHDVEHYRPKASADRTPGCKKRHGYWWLAYNWDNLLFACPGCNRTAKNDRFPLRPGSTSLIAENAAPGTEEPFLIDPSATENPVIHIEYRYEAEILGGPMHWWARPRDNSEIGLLTIDVCDLNRSDLREVRKLYVTTVVQPQLDALADAIRSQNVGEILKQFKRAINMFTPLNEFAALTFDVFCTTFDRALLENLIGKTWPWPRHACRS